MKEGRSKKAWKAKTPAEIYQLLESNISACQWKLILAGLVPLQYQDDEDETRVDISARKWSQTQPRKLSIGLRERQ